MVHHLTLSNDAGGYIILNAFIQLAILDDPYKVQHWPQFHLQRYKSFQFSVYCFPFCDLLFPFVNLNKHLNKRIEMIIIIFICIASGKQNRDNQIIDDVLCIFLYKETKLKAKCMKRLVKVGIYINSMLRIVSKYTIK